MVVNHNIRSDNTIFGVGERWTFFFKTSKLISWNKIALLLGKDEKMLGWPLEPVLLILTRPRTKLSPGMVSWICLGSLMRLVLQLRVCKPSPRWRPRPLRAHTGGPPSALCRYRAMVGGGWSSRILHP